MNALRVFEGPTPENHPFLPGFNYKPDVDRSKLYNYSDYVKNNKVVEYDSTLIHSDRDKIF